MWAPELVAQEHDAKQSASVLFYVVDSQTRSIAGMIEVAYLVAAGRCVILVAYPYTPGQIIMGETISQRYQIYFFLKLLKQISCKPVSNKILNLSREFQDLECGQSSLLALVKSQGVKVHTNLKSALQCTASLLKETNGLSSEDHLTFKLR